ncbi:hypothetical protein P9112_004273 [Eukaryota sp. TZLM1-RC]
METPPLCVVLVIANSDGSGSTTKVTFAPSITDAEMWVIQQLERILDGKLQHMFHSVVQHSKSLCEALQFFEDDILPELEQEIRTSNPKFSMIPVEWLITQCVVDGREFESDRFSLNLAEDD